MGQGRGRSSCTPACLGIWSSPTVQGAPMSSRTWRAARPNMPCGPAATAPAAPTVWAGYVAWCRALGREPLAGDPETIAMYAVRRADAGRALSSIRVDLAAIRTAHRLAGVPLDLRDARLAPVLEGIARTKGARPQRQAAPAVP